MFKGMEGQPMHVIGIIKNGYNPTEHFESIFSHQLSWSFGVLLAFKFSPVSINLNACMSMHMRTLIGHWLQCNLHAEHFFLATMPKPLFLVAPEVIGRLDQAPANTAL